MSWSRIAAFRLVTLDPERLLPFYAALGFGVEQPASIATSEMALLGVPGRGTRWTMRLGPSRVDLDRYPRSGRPYPAEADAASLCFQHLALVTSDADAAWSRAQMAGAVPISRGGRPVKLPASAGGVMAVKFRDPEGHPLEFLSFPDGSAKGWPGRGILGVDHSAVSVADGAASRAFYGDRGLSKGDPTLNSGPTQVALDALQDVEVDVIPMRPSDEPPHVELLHYRRPVAKSCGPVSVEDVAATRIVWSGYRPDLVRDPDGHLHELSAEIS